MGCFVNKVVEHEFLVEVDANELGGGSLHNELNAVSEAGLDLNVDLHVDDLGCIRSDLQAPDQDLGLVSGCADQELAVFSALVPNDHGRWVDQAHDLRNSLSRTGMGIKHLLDRRLLRIAVNVPNLELASKGADKQMIFINLVQNSWALLVVDLVHD